jgi:hypothetical protein
MSGYRGIIRVLDDSSGIHGLKPDGGTCDLCRHEVRVCRDQDAARRLFDAAERAADAREYRAGQMMRLSSELRARVEQAWDAR